MLCFLSFVIQHIESLFYNVLYKCVYYHNYYYIFIGIYRRASSLFYFSEEGKFVVNLKKAFASINDGERVFLLRKINPFTGIHR